MFLDVGSEGLQLGFVAVRPGPIAVDQRLDPGGGQAGPELSQRLSRELPPLFVVVSSDSGRAVQVGTQAELDAGSLESLGDGARGCVLVAGAGLADVTGGFLLRNFAGDVVGRGKKRARLTASHILGLWRRGGSRGQSTR